jgi:hypothetical protein
MNFTTWIMIQESNTIERLKSQIGSRLCGLVWISGCMTRARYFRNRIPSMIRRRRPQRLQRIEKVQMPKLEAQHARFLDPDWEPNPDWWGSLIVRD